MEGTFFDKEFLKKLDRLSLATQKVVKGSTGGQRKSQNKGSSVEFSDFREYSLGDDFRRVDWNAYARFERLFIKLFMEEQQSAITLFLDCSGSMDFGAPNKGVLAKQLSAIFSYLALNTYDRVSLVCIGEGIEGYLPPFSGKQGFWNALKYLEEVPFRGETSLNAAIRSYRSLGSGGGTSLILTDLFSRDGYEEAIKYLQYQNQEVSIIHILSPEEIDPSWKGSLRLWDKEDESFRDISMTPRILSAYRKTLDEFLQGIKGFCYNRGVHYLKVNSSEDLNSIVFDNLVKMGVIGS